MKEHPYRKELMEMTFDELLSEMDSYGEFDHIIHEAAERIRLLKFGMALYIYGIDTIPHFYNYKKKILDKKTKDRQ